MRTLILDGVKRAVCIGQQDRNPIRLDDRARIDGQVVAGYGVYDQTLSLGQVFHWVKIASGVQLRES